MRGQGTRNRQYTGLVTKSVRGHSVYLGRPNPTPGAVLTYCAAIQCACSKVLLALSCREAIERP